MFNFFDLQENFYKLRKILLNEYQESIFDFIKKRSFTEISGEKYFDNLFESLLYYKQKQDIRSLDMIDIRIILNSNTILEDLMEK